MTFFNFPRDSINWIGDRSSLEKTYYSAAAERAHCRKCGTPIYMRYYKESDRIGIAAGSITENTMKDALPKPDHHIFVAEKASWFDLPEDGLPRHDYHTDSFQEGLDAFKKA